MSAHPRPWHRGSTFGDGPRRPLDREQRARFRYLLNAHCRAGHITDKGAKVGEALLKRLSVDGRCDPSHQTLADDVKASTGKCSERTARRALDAMKGLGLVTWARRIVRAGWRVSQTSNAYVLVPLATVNPPAIRLIPSGGHSGRETRSESFISVQHPVSDVPEGDRIGARAALAEIAAKRQAVLQARLLGKGRVAAPA